MQLLKIMLSKNLGIPVWNCIPTTRMHIKDRKDIFQKVKTSFLSCRIEGSFPFLLFLTFSKSSEVSCMLLIIKGGREMSLKSDCN